MKEGTVDHVSVLIDSLTALAGVVDVEPTQRLLSKSENKYLCDRSLVIKHEGNCLSVPEVYRICKSLAPPGAIVACQNLRREACGCYKSLRVYFLDDVENPGVFFV